MTSYMFEEKFPWSKKLDLVDYNQLEYDPDFKDKIPNDQCWTNAIHFDVNYVVEWPDYSIEDEYMKMIGAEIVKSVDKEIMKCLTQGDLEFMKNNKYISTEMLFNHVCGIPIEVEDKYSNYDRAMSIIDIKGN
jgi:hypothetical protein